MNGTPTSTHHYYAFDPKKYAANQARRAENFNQVLNAIETNSRAEILALSDMMTRLDDILEMLTTKCQYAKATPAEVQETIGEVVQVKQEAAAVAKSIEQSTPTIKTQVQPITPTDVDPSNIETVSNPTILEEITIFPSPEGLPGTVNIDVVPINPSSLPTVTKDVVPPSVAMPHI